MEPAPLQPEQLVITGEKVALGLLRRELLPLYLKWHNDFEVTRTDGCEQRLTTWEAQEAWYERISKDERRTHFAVYERATMRPIGTTNLRDIDHYMGTAEFGVMIGEKDCWGRGYGTEATLLTLDYGFSALGHRQVLHVPVPVLSRALAIGSNRAERQLDLARVAIRRHDGRGRR